MQVQLNDVCYLFDMLRANYGVLHELECLLEDESIMKVVHDCRQDSAALLHQHDIHLKNIFDTQV